MDLIPASLAMFHKINEMFPNKSFPILGNLCTAHRKCNLEEQNSEDDDINDNDYKCNTSLNNSNLETVHSFIEGTIDNNMSPIKFRINKSVDELAESTIRYQKRKYKEFKELSKKSYLELVAPGQEEAFSAILTSESESEDCNDIPENLKFLYEAYAGAESEK